MVESRLPVHRSNASAGAGSGHSACARVPPEYREGLLKEQRERRAAAAAFEQACRDGDVERLTGVADLNRRWMAISNAKGRKAKQCRTRCSKRFCRNLDSI